MFTANRQTALGVLYLMGASCCAYSDGEAWSPRCDCKYGIGERDGWPTMHESGNGCPELRSLHSLIEAMTDDEWAMLTTRAGGVPSGYFAASPDDVSARLQRANVAAERIDEQLTALRRLLSLEVVT
jgi:hypothetical protein